MLWDIVEKLTGVDRRHLKDSIHTWAANYVESNTCKCGGLKWAHNPQTGACSHCTQCNGFKPKSS